MAERDPVSVVKNEVVEQRLPQELAAAGSPPEAGVAPDNSRHGSLDANNWQLSGDTNTKEATMSTDHLVDAMHAHHVETWWWNHDLSFVVENRESPLFAEEERRGGQ